MEHVSCEARFQSWTPSWKKFPVLKRKPILKDVVDICDPMEIISICGQFVFSLCVQHRKFSQLSITQHLSLHSLFSRLIRMQNNLNKMTTLTFPSNTIIIVTLYWPETKGNFIFCWSHTSFYTWKITTLSFSQGCFCQQLWLIGIHRKPSASYEHDKSQIRWAGCKTKSCRKGIISNSAFWQNLLRASAHAASLNDVERSKVDQLQFGMHIE